MHSSNADSLMGVDFEGPASPAHFTSLNGFNAMRIFAELHGSATGRRDEVLARAIPSAATKTKLNYYYKVHFLEDTTSKQRQLLI